MKFLKDIMVLITIGIYLETPIQLQMENLDVEKIKIIS